MTQPAKVQEPSMEEILASIRRIIADDEAKPPVVEKTAGPAAVAKPEKPPMGLAVKAPVMNDIPPSTIPAAKAVAKGPAAVAAPSPPPAKPGPTPAATNNQDDIDAMLAGLDEATSEAEIRPPQPDGEVFELTDEMAVPASPAPSFQKVEPTDDLEFTETVAARTARQQSGFQLPPLASAAAPSPQQILSHSTVSAGSGSPKARSALRKTSASLRTWTRRAPP